MITDMSELLTSNGNGFTYQNKLEFLSIINLNNLKIHKILYLLVKADYFIVIVMLMGVIFLLMMIIRT